MNSVHRIAAVQMVSGPDVAANLAAAERLIGEAAAAGAASMHERGHDVARGVDARDGVFACGVNVGDQHSVSLRERGRKSFLALAEFL